MLGHLYKMAGFIAKQMVGNQLKSVKGNYAWPSVQDGWLYTPASNLGYLAPPPPQDNFHGCQIVNWDPLDGKRRCPQKNFGLGYVQLHGFYANP